MRFLSLAALFLASSLTAQTVTFTARIERAPANPCDPTATHKVACTDVLLKSSVVNLTALEGQRVTLDGAFTLGACITVDVTASATATYRHTVTSSNSFRLGSNVSFRGTCPFAGFVVLVLSAGSSFLPLSTFGAYMLDLPTSLLIGINLGLLGSQTTVIQIPPNDVSLIGGVIYSQTIWLDVLSTPANGGLVNSECFTILQ
jgi:hypothetical protein